MVLLLLLLLLLLLPPLPLPLPLLLPWAFSLCRVELLILHSNRAHARPNDQGQRKFEMTAFP